MVEQVRLTEVFSFGDSKNIPRVVFAFGTYPDATPDEAHLVTSAKASGNKLRIIMDELLRGNNLEEILCRFVVDDDAYAQVPVGATPDDIARCSVAQDVLPSRCPGSNRLSVCLCQNDGGCLVGVKSDGTPNITPQGQSVGVLDADQDGAADNTRFIKGAVKIGCGAFDVPIDLDMSYWTPSGDQQQPAQGGLDALGPAIVLTPQGSLPTNLSCGVTFSSDVVDKDNNQVCAPVDGELANGCSPGDTSAFKFTVEPLRFDGSVNPDAQSPKADLTITANADLDPTTVIPANFTVTDGTTPVTQFTVKLGAVPLANQITITWTTPLAGLTHYTITVAPAVTDVYRQSAITPQQFGFTTAAM